MNEEQMNGRQEILRELEALSRKAAKLYLIGDHKQYIAVRAIGFAAAMWSEITPKVAVSKPDADARNDTEAPEEPNHNVRAGQLRFARRTHLEHAGHYGNAMEVLSVDGDSVRYNMKRGGEVYIAHVDLVMETHPFHILQDMPDAESK